MDPNKACNFPGRDSVRHVGQFICTVGKFYPGIPTKVLREVINGLSGSVAISWCIRRDHGCWQTEGGIKSKEHQEQILHVCNRGTTAIIEKKIFRVISMYDSFVDSKKVVLYLCDV